MSHGTRTDRVRRPDDVDHGPCRATRIRILLTLGQSFSRAQAAYLMSWSAHWGRETAWAEGYVAGEAEALTRWRELADAAASADSAAAIVLDIERRRYRAELDAQRAALHQVPVLVGYHGGPVPDWDFGPEAAARVEAMNAELAKLPRVPAGEAR